MAQKVESRTIRTNVLQHWGFVLAVRGHSITTWTRWGSKNVCFCPCSGYKNCPRRGGGQKMVKLCPRSCWMTPFLNLAVGFGEQDIIFHVKHVTTLQMLKKPRLSYRFSPKFKENAQWKMGTKPNTLMAWRSVDWYQKRLISNQCLEFCTVVIR